MIRGRSLSPGLWAPGLDRLSGRTTSTGAPAALGLWPLSWPGQQLFRWTKAPPPRPPHPALQKQKVGAQQSVGWRPVGSHLYEWPRTGRPWEAVPAGSLSVFSRLRCGSRGSAPAWPVVQGQAGVRPLTRTSAPGCPPPTPCCPTQGGRQPFWSGAHVSLHIRPPAPCLCCPLWALLPRLPIFFSDQNVGTGAALSVRAPQPKWIKALCRRGEPAKKKI